MQVYPPAALPLPTDSHAEQLEQLAARIRAEHDARPAWLANAITAAAIRRWNARPPRTDAAVRGARRHPA